MLGAAYQAKFGLMKSQNKELTFSDVTSTAPAPKLVCTPSHDARQVVHQLLLFSSLYLVPFSAFKITLKEN